jgi:[DsrC]-trisulfide reductase subunit J
MGRLLGLLILSLLWLPLTATADDVETLPFSNLSFPEPARHYSATQECVEPEEEMRKNHMNYILHQRDETVHEGIRTRQHSLEECVNCHAVKDEQGEYIPVNAQDQFCSSCHSYASVNIDCFQCHATRPERSSTLHKLSGGAAVHHSDQPLTSSTLQILAAEGKNQ